MEALQELIASLVERNWAVTEQFLPQEILSALYAGARSRWEQGNMRPAGTGRGRDFAVREEIRGDHICWIDPQHPCNAAESAYVQAMEALRVLLNRELFLSLVDFEAHYAVYPPGAFYRRHVDCFRTDDRRMLSTVLYLNPGWNARNGGQLRLHHPDGCWTDILPRMGTFVIFCSDAVPHEVLPASTWRFSLTAWLRRRGLLPF
ncbi:MAG: 2OG-Fe(II) oxygenase [Chloroherpetonaceae bacterium]|nr:2OG-Fe(II) oxygenase [Chthonomonadaceae bacterium]MDW8208776.1 2OG-Fe(II) oxygenase [Chloroherpetonaceae bacterium]